MKHRSTQPKVLYIRRATDVLNYAPLVLSRCDVIKQLSWNVKKDKQCYRPDFGHKALLGTVTIAQLIHSNKLNFIVCKSLKCFLNLSERSWQNDMYYHTAFLPLQYFYNYNQISSLVQYCP